MNSKAMFLITALSIFAAMMTVFIAAMVLDVRNELEDFKATAVTQDVLAQSQIPELRLFALDKCTSCHTERRFLTEHKTSDELLTTVRKMATMEDVHLSESEMDEVHASLNTLKCTQCHDTKALRSMALKSDAERLAIIKSMAKKPGSVITEEEVSEIHSSFEMILGF